MSIVLLSPEDTEDDVECVLIPGKRGVTTCEYVSNHHAHLSYTASEPIQLVNICDNSEYLNVMNLDGDVGLVKASNIEFYMDAHLLLLDFYHGKTRSSTVDSLMELAEPGSYLLRDSCQYENALSLEIKCKCPEKIHRIRIFNKNSVFKINQEYYKDIGNIIKAATIHEDEPDYQIKFTYPILTKNLNRDYVVAKTLMKNKIFLRTNRLRLDMIKGRGQYGEIYIGKYNGKEVAVKTLINTDTKDTFCSFAHEVSLMIELYHNNVAHLLGCIIEDVQIVKVVMEWCDNGDLQSYITKVPIATRTMFEIISQICEGFEYIHLKKIVHGDIAARNILLTKDMVPKITDFGFASYEKRVFLPKSKVPKRWMSPEAITTRTMNLISDVWSFGVLMWEVYSFGDMPFKDVNPSELQQLLTEKGLRLTKATICPDKIYNLMLECWNVTPQERITFKQLNVQLKTLKNQIT